MLYSYIFDDAADERQVPESLKNTTAGHDPCRVGKEVHFVKKEKLTDRCLLISACLQKETGFSDKQHVLNEDSVEKREQYPQEKQKNEVENGSRKASLTVFKVAKIKDLPLVYILRMCSNRVASGAPENEI